MKIAYLAWESLHSARAGGLAVVSTRLAEEVAKRGHEVHLFTRAAEGQSVYEFINGVHYHRCKFNLGQNTLAFAYNMSMSMVSSLHAVEKQGKFDLVHGHDWHIVDALHVLKKEGHPTVITYHSTQYGRSGNKFSDWGEGKEISGKEWYGGYLADRVTTVSNTMKAELSWLYKIPDGKIDVIPNAIDPRKYQMRVDSGKIKEGYGIHPLAPTVMFVGRTAYQKGPDLLLEAIPKVLSNRWDTKFIFAGDGDMRSHLERRANELKVAHAAKFLGFLSYWPYIELLNSCDIVCIPSRNEPFGIVLLEAWATGRPVVATDVGGMGENVDNFVNGVKVYPNPDSIAWGINYLLNSPDAMKQAANGGMEKVKQFSWDNVLEKFMKTYQTVLKK